MTTRRRWILGWAMGLLLVGCAPVPPVSVPPVSVPPASVTPVSVTPVSGTPGVEPSRVFDRVELQDAVRRILTAPVPGGYALDAVGALDCPADQEVVAGSVFTCSVALRGEGKIVPVTVLDGDGRYEVSPPR